MGFFGKKKTIIVSSTVYNMAGDEEDRPNFLKNSIYAAVMSDNDPYLGETIVRNYMIGPGMNQRHFIKWAIRQNYAGLPTFYISKQSEVDEAIVSPFIPTPGSPAGLVIDVQSASVQSGSYEFLVDEYVLANYPENFNTDYVSAFDEDASEITIQWEGGGSVTFSSGTWNKTKQFVVATYYHSIPSDLEDVVTGGTTTADTSQPSTTGYTQESSTTTGIVNYEMTYDEQVLTTYTGSEPPTLPTDTDETTYGLLDDVDFDGVTEEWRKTVYEGGDGDEAETISKEYFLHWDEYREIYTNNTVVSIVVNEDTPVAGQTETILTRRIGDHLRPVYDHRTDTQDTILDRVYGGALVWWYEVGTGEATLDDLIENISENPADAQYFPFMPIRLDNTSITHADYDDITGSGLYEMTNRAYRRATGGGERFSKLVDQVEDNESIDDIDYAFTHHGVALHVIEPSCRKYMYKWFRGIMEHQNTGPSYMDGYKTLADAFVAAWAAYNAWVYAQGDPARNGYGDAQPPVPKLKDLEKTTITLRCADSQLKNLDMRVSWVNISETIGVSGTPTNPDTGNPAVKGDVWMQGETDVEWAVTRGIGVNAYTEDYKVERLDMYWMTASGTYDKLVMYGLVHNNYVYGGEAVTTQGKEALADDEPTGFLIPLHYPTMQALGLKDATQMATANTFIIFNSYEIVKQKWYETYIGMIIIIIVVIVLVVITGGLAGGGVGILGSNAAVGAALGLTGTAAIVAGAIVNAIVAIAISKIVTWGSTKLFGDKWGAIIAAVINLAISMGTSGVGFDNLSELGSASNILKISSAIANGYQGYTQGAIAEIGDDMVQNQEDFNTGMEKIDDLLRKLRGTSGLNFDPLTLTDSVRGNDRATAGGGYITETLDQFIHRTTLTGSDIADITLAMVNDFADLSLELP